jgi:hypothetical protein
MRETTTRLRVFRAQFGPKIFMSAIFFVGALILPGKSVCGQVVVAPNLHPFDQYGRGVGWEDEKKKLGLFASELRNHQEMIGYVYVQEAQISCAGNAVAAGIGVTKYLIKKHHIPWNRVAWRDLGYGDSFVISLWLFPAGQPPRYQPKYQPETNYTFIEDCLMMARNWKSNRARRFIRKRAR